MDAKRVLIVENEDLQREALEQSLARRGFEVWGAKDVTSARRIGRDKGSMLDVVVLDMRLEDPTEPGILGTDIGFEINSQLRNDRPEFLILSAYPEVDYLRNALKLGAAAYLRKPVATTPEVIRHVRALALRRGLAREPEEKSREVRRIVKMSRNEVEAGLLFCREILTGHFPGVLGGPFILLLSTREGTCAWGDPLSAKEGEEEIFFERVAGLVFGKINQEEPFVLTRHGPTERALGEEHLLDALEGAALVPLAETRDFRLSLGVLPGTGPLADEPAQLATVVGRYVRSTITSQLLEVVALWSELKAHHQAMLAATSRFCLHVGQEQNAILDRARKRHAMDINESALNQLREFGEELYENGHLLAELYGRSLDSSPGVSGEEQPTDLSELAVSIWQSLAGASGLTEEIVEVTGGDCKIEGDLDDLSFIITYILQWLVSRLRVAKSSMRSIRVHCEEDDRFLAMSFKDGSRRLPAELRDELFLPFSEPIQPEPPEPASKGRPRGYLKLFLANALLELRCGGYIEDRTNDFPGNVGHHFVIHLPKALPSLR